MKLRTGIILLIIFIIAGLFSVKIALLLKQDPGYMLLSVGQWTIETTVAALIVFSVVAFVLLYWAVRFLMGLLHMPAATRAANKRHQKQSAQRLFVKGMKANLEGRWAAAEVALSKGADNGELPALYYAGAAQAAQRLNAQWRRDGYLRKAAELPQKDSALVANLARAELLLEDGEAAKARSILLELRTTHPRHPRLLALLAQAGQAQGEWSELREILPEIKKQEILPPATLSTLQSQTYSGLLTQAASRGNVQDLRTLWQEAPLSIRSDENLLIEYAGHLRDNDASKDAEVVLRNALQERWSDRLIIGYGQIDRGNAAGQLSTAERWLDKQGKDSHLLLTLGRLAKRCRQPEKSKGYLEESLKAQPSPDAYEEIGEIFEELGDKEAARLSYRAALRLLSGKPEDKEGDPLLASVSPAPEEQGEASLLLPAAEESKPASLEKSTTEETPTKDTPKQVTDQVSKDAQTAET